MRELLKSFASFTWASSLFAASQFRHAVAGDRVRPAPSGRQRAGSLDTSVFLVMGEGLAAGMGDFTLCSTTQIHTFGARMARQMQCDFAQPLLEPPGLGDPPGFPRQPVIVPAPFQTTVFEQLPPPPLSNLSVPGLTVHDALTLRPAPPIVNRQDARQTACNLLLGAGALARGEPGPLSAQFDYALARRPALTIVSLGQEELRSAAAAGDLRACPAAGEMLADFRRIVSGLRRAGSEVLLLTIPDPMDSAYFCAIDQAAEVLRVEPAWLRDVYGCAPSDLLTVPGLNEIGFQIFGRKFEPLPPRCFVSAAFGEQVHARVDEINAGLAALARDERALLYDLRGLLRCLSRNGIATRTRVLTAGYLGGFYGLTGWYPGAAGHALIANELLAFLNAEFGADFPIIDLDAVVAADPVAAYRPATGARWRSADLQSVAPAVHPASVESSSPAVPSDPAGAAPLQLPESRELILPLNPAASYFGDGISPLNCATDRDIQWGCCANWLFGGLAMVDSHLRGFLRVRFAPPAGNLSRFELSFLEGLEGEEATLACPSYFKMAFRQNRVDDVPGNISTGTVNLATGEVSDLRVFARYSSTALAALVSVNPTFPRQPLTFPGQYGSAWARFDHRPDGRLDFSFYGSTFVPLGRGIVWPLNFSGPEGRFATVPANGTVMHPHLCLSTRQTEPPPASAPAPRIPFNSVRELTLHTHNSSFGDGFTLNIPELGGSGKGRSHVLGRLWVQFGPRCGNSVPVAAIGMKPGGLFLPLESSSITDIFPGRLTPGPQGFDELLRFPQRTYSLDDLMIATDPFDIPVGALDLNSGRFLADFLHRGFIHQDLIFALLRVEPRTPKDSFFFRGPAVVEGGEGRALAFRLRGTVRIPYPEGFGFPQPNFSGDYKAGPDSRLDPFLWLRAVEDCTSGSAIRGAGKDIVASSGDRFSYRYSIPADPAREQAVFEFWNHSQRGSFRMHTLSWVGLGWTPGAPRQSAPPDTISFSGFGVWSKDGLESLQQAAVQVSKSAPYVGIQVADGAVSNVNTKPPNEEDALP